MIASDEMSGDEAEVRALELQLLDPEVRRDPAAIEALLHPQFEEFGASGRVWDRPGVVAALRGELGAPVSVACMESSLLAPGVVLVTYRAAPGAGGASLRSSVWVRDAAGWRVRFHQGTPAPPG
ncbi:MAG TPA: nuclear transport factor 2 family protein [Solirubrobacteraceae bacterium]|nr:nuclear transport factor 2 family protein [Solirubrobacteraceae bacterium]